jgi:hypothetical protein
MGMCSAQATRRKGKMSKRSKNQLRDEFYEEEDYEESKRDKHRDIIRKTNRRMKSAINTRDIDELMKIQDEY